MIYYSSGRLAGLGVASLLRVISPFMNVPSPTPYLKNCVIHKKQQLSLTPFAKKRYMP